MENSTFWAFFVIALVVGLASGITLTNSTITGKSIFDIFWPQQEEQGQADQTIGPSDQAIASQPPNTFRPPCVDSDHGLIMNKGTCRDTTGSYEDYCVTEEGPMVEYYCSREDNFCRSINLYCTNCDEGTCWDSRQVPVWDYRIMATGMTPENAIVFLKLRGTPEDREPDQFNIGYLTFSTQRGFMPFCLNLNGIVNRIDVENKIFGFSFSSFDEEFPIADAVDLSIGEAYNNNGLYLKVFDIFYDENYNPTAKVEMNYNLATYPYDAFGPCDVFYGQPEQ